MLGWAASWAMNVLRSIIQLCLLYFVICLQTANLCLYLCNLILYSNTASRVKHPTVLFKSKWILVIKLTKRWTVLPYLVRGNPFPREINHEIQLECIFSCFQTLTMIYFIAISFSISTVLYAWVAAWHENILLTKLLIRKNLKSPRFKNEW